MATASGWAGTAIIRSRGSIARSARPGRTRICAICAGTCSLICFSPMSAPRPERRSPGRIAIRSPAANGCSCTTALSAVGAGCAARSRRLIPDELYPARIGTTDSEAVFLAMLGAGIDDPVGAAETVLARLTTLVNETSPPDRLRFTAALSNGRDLYAFRYAVNDRANTLYYRESERRHRHRFRAARPRPQELDRGAGEQRRRGLRRRAGAHRAAVPSPPGSGGVATPRRYGFQPCCQAGGVLPSIRMKAMRHGLVPLLTQA